MTLVQPTHSPTAGPRPGRWHELAERVLEGQPLTPEQGLAILRSGDEELLDLLAAAYRVRRRWFGNQVHLNFLVNARCGACSEDCGYCSQSKISKADITPHSLVDAEELVSGARMAVERQAKTYCIVTSGLRPSPRDLDTVLDAVARIKAECRLKVCVSLGLLTAEQARRLKAGGVDRVNHNLNTSRRFYPHICTTHSYQDRLDTLRAVRATGMEICSGGIVGMGEEDADVVNLVLELAAIGAEAVPINFLLPIAGIGLYGAIEPVSRDDPGDSRYAAPGHPEGTRSHFRRTKIGTVPGELNPRYCLKVLALVRLANPRCELRIAAGREAHLGCLQPLGLYAANSIFVSDYLTTKGQSPEEDFAMIRALGFEIVVGRITDGRGADSQRFRVDPAGPRGQCAIAGPAVRVVPQLPRFRRPLAGREPAAGEGGRIGPGAGDDAGGVSRLRRGSKAAASRSGWPG